MPTQRYVSVSKVEMKGCLAKYLKEPHTQDDYVPGAKTKPNSDIRNGKSARSKASKIKLVPKKDDKLMNQSCTESKITSSKSPIKTERVPVRGSKQQENTKSQEHSKLKSPSQKLTGSTSSSGSSKKNLSKGSRLTSFSQVFSGSKSKNTIQEENPTKSKSLQSKTSRISKLSKTFSSKHSNNDSKSENKVNGSKYSAVEDALPNAKNDGIATENGSREVNNRVNCGSKDQPHVDPLSSPSLVRRHLRQGSSSKVTEKLLKNTSNTESSSSMVVGTSESNVDKDKRERIQKYKEERRKQIAARYGKTEHSSEEEAAEEGGAEGQTASYKAYRRRRKHQRDGSGTRSSCDRSAPFLSNAGDSANNNQLKTTRDVPKKAVTETKIPSIKPPEKISPRVPPLSSPQKDKSNKRMSNLNRASTSEEAVEGQVEGIPPTNESGERRRRRLNTALSPSSTPSSSLRRSPSLPLKTPDVVRGIACSMSQGPTSPPPVFTSKTVQSSPFIPPRLPQISPNSRVPQARVSRLPTKSTSPPKLNRRSLSPITHAAFTNSYSSKKAAASSIPLSKGVNSEGASNTISSSYSSLKWEKSPAKPESEVKSLAFNSGENKASTLPNLKRRSVNVGTFEIEEDSRKSLDTNDHLGTSAVQQKCVRNRVNFGDIDVRSDYDTADEILNVPLSESPDFSRDQEAVLAIAGDLIHGRALSLRSLDGSDHSGSTSRRAQSSPEPLSILKRRNSRDEPLLFSERPVTPEPQSILKRKSWSRGSSSRASSIDTLDENELVPILKKRSSMEEMEYHSFYDLQPKPILKKKSSTDDELEDRPKSILKSARSGEDIHHCDSGVVSPTPILKRCSIGRCDSDGEELKPILKRRDTTDGVRLQINLSDEEEGLVGSRLRSDSAPDTAYSSHPPSSYPHSTDSSPSRAGRPSILKKRATSSQAFESDRWAGGGSSLLSDNTPQDSFKGGARPKTTRTSSFSSRGEQRDTYPSRRSSWANSESFRNWTSFSQSGVNSPETSTPNPHSARLPPKDTPHSTPPTPKINFGESDSSEDEITKEVEARNLDTVASDAALFLALTSSAGEDARELSEGNTRASTLPLATSSVAKRMAFFSQLEELNKCEATKDRAPIKSSEKGMDEDSYLHQPLSNHLHSSSLQSRNSWETRNGGNSSHSVPPLPASSPPRWKGGGGSVYERVAQWSKLVVSPESSGGRKRPVRYQTQPVTLKEVIIARNRGITSNECNILSSGGGSEEQSTMKGILKRDGSKDSSPLVDSPRSILKCGENISSSDPPPPLSDTEISSSISSPPPPTDSSLRFGLLKGVLKKECEVGDGKAIKSILKTPQMEFVRHSSDSSSDDQAFVGRQLLNQHSSNTSVNMQVPIAEAEDLGAALRQIESIAREQREGETTLTMPSSHCDSISSDSSTSTGGDTIGTSPPPAPLLSVSAPTDSYRNGSLNATDILEQSPLFRQRLDDDSKNRRNNRVGVLGDLPQNSSSLHSRLAALQKNGEEGWKTRVKKEGDTPVNLRVKSSSNRPVSLQERMSLLENSSESWRGRVTQSDAVNFTVSHRLKQTGLLDSSSPAFSSGGEDSGPPSPLSKVRRTPQPKVFKSKTGSNLPETLTASRDVFKRSLSQPGEQKHIPPTAGATVEVFSAADEDFNNFFSVTSKGTSELMSVAEPSFELTDLDQITSSAQPLPVVMRRVKRTARHHRPVSGNPLRSSAIASQSHYTETRLHAGERELKRNKVEELSRSSVYAVEALAGLASKENFSAVSLKPMTTEDTRELPPYTHPMLIRVKGRRHAEVRLMDPVTANVNNGDDFVLVTPNKVYHYKGEFANVIERAKASEIAAYIVQHRDLGVNTTAPLVEINENVKGMRRSDFYHILGGSTDTECITPEGGGDDEEVEACLARTNKVYRVGEEACLLPHEEAWGKPPTVEILKDDEVLVFDFGSEVYSWSGKRACPTQRKAALHLARELWDTPYDYSDCDINPVIPSDDSMKGSRPSWGILGKVTQNIETVLFKQKFIDWPDTAQQAKIKEVKKEMSRRVDPVSCLQPISGMELVNTLPDEPDIELEMTHLGRGVQYYDAQERRLLVVHTKEHKVWHTSESGNTQLSGEDARHLHSGETYVVRWYYSVTATGRTLKGAPSKHAVTGRDRVAYFFWQGRDSSLSNKGASALMTVELDEERGPHIRVTMNQEPPAFLNIFSGGLVIHQGRREGVPPSTLMFLIRGETEKEGHLVSVDPCKDHLRSRGCVLVVNNQTNVVHLWMGCKTLKHTRDIAKHSAKQLICSTASAIGWNSAKTPRVKEQNEGAESSDFWESLNESTGHSHLSLLNDSESSFSWTLRVWHLTAKHDSFEASEVLSSYRLGDVTNPLPLLQEQLYDVPQPALFLVDAGGKVWLWQGFWPQENENNNNKEENNIILNEDTGFTGSAALRFTFARKAALQTTLNYADALGAKLKGEPQLILAGLEPQEFTNLFPMWIERKDATKAQIKSGRYTAESSQFPIQEILSELSRSHYTLSELQAYPPPEGVDPSRMEDYLTEEDFLDVLGTTKEEFVTMQAWKQLEMKKKANLF